MVGSSKISSHSFLKPICRGRNTKYISFAVIPLAILLFYGIEDKTAGYFDNKNYFWEDYRYQIDRVTVNNGLMVSHWANIAVVSVILILISLIIHALIEAEKERNKEFVN